MKLKKAREIRKTPKAFPPSGQAIYDRVAGRLAVRQGCVLSEEPVLIPAFAFRKMLCAFRTLTISALRQVTFAAIGGSWTCLRS